MPDRFIVSFRAAHNGAEHGRNGPLFDIAAIRDQLLKAEAAGADFVILGGARHADGAPAGHAPILLAAHLAQSTTTLGLVAQVSPVGAEPLHLSTGLATLDYVSHGRAGWALDLDNAADASEAREVLAASVGLWDSWEDDAEIRDVATGRFLDGSRLHRVNFSGEHFSIAGPSITPRPPQGHPLVVWNGDADLLGTGTERGFVDFVNHPDASGGLLEVNLLSGPQPTLEWGGVTIPLTDLASAASRLHTVIAERRAAGVVLVPTDPGASPVLIDFIAELHGLRAAPGAGPLLRQRLGLPRPENLYETRKA